MKMGTKESGATEEGSARPEAAAKVAITPRKALMPFSSGKSVEPGLQLSPTGNEAAWARKNRICPKSPKDPLLRPSRSIRAPEIPQKNTFLPQHGEKRGLLAFFQSRRKGRSRIWNFLLLPAAVLAASLVILVLFKFL